MSKPVDELTVEELQDEVLIFWERSKRVSITEPVFRRHAQCIERLQEIFETEEEELGNG